MKKKEGPGIGLLLLILILFSASLGILHGRKLTAEQPNEELSLSVQDTLDYLHPLLQAKSIATAAKTLGKFDSKKAEEVTQRILQETDTLLSSEDKIAFGIGIYATQTNPELRGKIYTILENQYKNSPIFFIALAYSFPSAIALLKEAMKDKQSQLQIWVYESFKDAIDKDNLSIFNQLIEHDLKLASPIEASQLLDYVVSEKKDTMFVEPLIEQLQADVNYSADKKHTLLMKAVLLNDLDMVRALLTQGADSDIVLDSAVGNAHQLAFEKGFVDIELLLKNMHNNL